LVGDEINITALKGEYVLSREDVDFIKKVKNPGEVNYLPPILPRIAVNVQNSSSVGQVTASGAIRVSDDKYVIDVVLKDIARNGRLRQALSFI
jgi:hypothetical protein